VELGGGVDVNTGRLYRVNEDLDSVGTVVSFDFTDGATVVLVDNKVACANKEKCSKELSKGKHSVTVSRDGYRDSTFGITVPNGSNRYMLALQSKAGVLTLRASDAESEEDVVAQVVIDGNVVGTTPWSGMVAMNARKIVLKADGYDDVEVRERAEEGQKRSVSVKLLEKLRLDSYEIKEKFSWCDGRQKSECISLRYTDECDVDCAETVASVLRNKLGIRVFVSTSSGSLGLLVVLAIGTILVEQKKWLES